MMQARSRHGSAAGGIKLTADCEPPLLRAARGRFGPGKCCALCGVRGSDAADAQGARFRASADCVVRRAIANGEAKPGERLPPACDLAAVLGVNTNTVLRALRLLRDEGLLDFRRGRGITVAGTAERGAVLTQARELLQFARAQGFRREDVIALIEQL